MDLSSIAISLTGVLEQAMTIITLILGIVLGEFITMKVFGKPKPIAVFVDLIVFVVTITIIFNFMSFQDLGLVYYITTFIVGTVVIVIIRAIEAPLGLTEKIVEREKMVVRLIRTLARHGLTKEEIKDALKRSGFPKDSIKGYEGLIQPSTPKYISKIVKMENEIEELNAKITKLTKKKKKVSRALPKRRKRRKKR